MTPDSQDRSVTVVPATSDLWPDAEVVFGTRGDSSWCFCLFFLTRGDGYQESVERNRSALRAQLSQQPHPGLPAYAGTEPVGWVQVGPRASYPRVTGNRRRTLEAHADAGLVEVLRTRPDRPVVRLALA